jgi:hypothetical protein
MAGLWQREGLYKFCLVLTIIAVFAGLKYSQEIETTQEHHKPANPISLRGAPGGTGKSWDDDGSLPKSSQVERHIGRLHSWEDVRKAFEAPLERREPFVIASQLTKEWQIFQEWGSMQALKQRVGENEALVSVGRAIEGSEDDTIPGHTIQSALDASLSGELGQPAFVGFRPTLDQWTEMRQHLMTPEYFDDTRFLSCLGPQHMAEFYEAFNWKMFFMTQPGAGMHMHTDADRAHLYTLQLGGTKSWFLCRGNETRGVYSGRVDAFGLENAGERFPIFAQTQPRCYRTDLTTGEILYWHSDWWHQTYVGENATDPSFSILSLFIDEDILRLKSPKSGKPVFDLMRSHNYNRKSDNREFPEKLSMCMKQWRNKVNRWDMLVGFMSRFGFSL